MSKWTFVPQPAGDDEVVDCKLIKFFPPTEDPTTGKKKPGGRLPNPCFRLFLTPKSDPALDPSERDKCITIRYSLPRKNRPNGTFSVEWFGKWEVPPMKDVTGKTIKRVRLGVDTVMRDRLQDAVLVPGRKTTHESQATFESRLREFLDEETINMVLDTLAEAIADTFGAKKAA